MVRLLLNHGANPNAKTNNGKTALMLLAFLGNSAAVELLIHKKVDVNAKDADGKSALDYATEDNYPNVIRLLKRAGAK